MPVKLVTVPVKIGDISCRALIDTGASTSLITRNLVENEIVPLRDSRVIRGLGGSTITRVDFQKLGFSIGSLYFEETFIVVLDNVIRNPVILGSTFFMNYKLTVDLSQKKLSGGLGGGSWEIYCNDNEPEFVYRDISLILPWCRSNCFSGSR